MMESGEVFFVSLVFGFGVERDALAAAAATLIEFSWAEGWAASKVLSWNQREARPLKREMDLFG